MSNQRCFQSALLVLILVLFGLYFRLLNVGIPTQRHSDIRQLAQIAHFMKSQSLPDARWVHYTRDKGIIGLEISVPNCHGNLQIVVMPEGDEFVSVWETRRNMVNYESAYLFYQQVYQDFPRLNFWIHTMLYAIAIKLGVENVQNPGPVIAMAFPSSCDQVNATPWESLIIKG